MAKELFAKRKATFVESMSSNSKTSSLSQQQQSQPPTFLLASTVDPPEHSSSSSSSSASSSSANSDIILPMQAEKDYYESNEINYDAKYPDIADSNSNSNLNYDDLTDDMDPAKKTLSSHPSHLL
jgi:patatin-like phospholipase/acyl hydrolase